MNIRESLAQSLDNLAKRKLRALLTMLGIIFGVGAVISMLSIGAGAEDQALQVIRQMGLRNIMIEGKEYAVEDLRKVREKSLGLSRRDLQALLAVTPNIVRGAWRKTVKAYQVFSEQGKVESRVVAVDAAYLRLKNLTLLDSAFFDGRDEETYAQVCVLGAAAKQDLFGFERAVGRQLKINNVWFSVVGVIADQSLSKGEFEGVKLQNTNNDIYIPLSTALKKIEFKPLESELDGIVLEVADERQTQATALVVSHMLDKLHNGEADYSLVIPEQLLRQSQQTRAHLQHRDGLHRGHFAAGRRHRHYEHHAGERAGTHQRDRRPPSHRRAPCRHPAAIPDRGDHHQRARRLVGRGPGLCDCAVVGLLRGLVHDHHAVVGGAGVRGLDSGGHSVRLVSGGAGFAAESD
jgi:hypothetical protein